MCARAFEVDKQKRSMQANVSRLQAGDACTPSEHCSGILIKVIRQKESRLRRAQGVLHWMGVATCHERITSHRHVKAAEDETNQHLVPSTQRAADSRTYQQTPVASHVLHCGRYTRRSRRRVRDKKPMARVIKRAATAKSS